MEGKGRNAFIALSTFVAWVTYAVFYVYLRQQPETIIFSGYLALVGEAGLDLVAASLAFWIWKKADQGVKPIYLILCISFILACISDATYNVMLNIKQISMPSIVSVSLFDIPFIGFLLCQIIVWGMIFINADDTKAKKWTTYAPYIMTALLIFTIFTFGVTWRIKYFSVIGMYQMIDTVLEVIGFALAAFCLARSKLAFIKCLAAGYLVIIASDFIIRYSVVEQMVTPANFWEAAWVLGLLLVVISFFLSNQKQRLVTDGYLH